MFNRIVYLSIVASIGVISASLCAPALPFIGDHFSASFSYLQFTISLFLVGNACGQFLSGPISDQIGQRKVLLGGVFLYCLASSACALADQMSILLAARFFQGMGSAVGPVLARAIAASSYTPKKSAQVQSYGAIGVGVASIVAILCSGQLTLVSWRGNFWLAAGLGLIILAWTAITLKDSALPINSFSLKQMSSQLKQVLKHPCFLGATFCHSMTYGLMYGYITLFPFMLIEFFHEKNPAQISLYSAGMIVCYMCGAFSASRFILNWTQNRLIALGISLQLASGILLLLAHSSVSFMVALCLFNFSIGIILPITSAKALAPFVGFTIGTASSSLGLSYRMIGSVLSTLICLLPVAGGKNLGMSIIGLSAASLIILRLLLSIQKPEVEKLAHTQI